MNLFEISDDDYFIHIVNKIKISNIKNPKEIDITWALKFCFYSNDEITKKTNKIKHINYKIKVQSQTNHERVNSP